MEKSLYFDLLEFLYSNGINQNCEIDSILLKWYPDNIDYGIVDRLAQIKSFLNKMDADGYIRYSSIELNDKSVFSIFSNDQTFIAQITVSGFQFFSNAKRDIATENLNNAVKKSLYIQIVIGLISTVAIVLTAVYAILGYQKEDSINVVSISKSLQRQEQILDSILKLQKERSTPLKKVAKKVLAKKK